MLLAPVTRSITHPQSAHPEWCLAIQLLAEEGIDCVLPLAHQKLLAGLDGDIGPELKASGFERDYQLTLEEWTAQQPAEAEEGDVSELNDRLSELGAERNPEAGNSSEAEREAVGLEWGVEAEEQGKAVEEGAATQDQGASECENPWLVFNHSSLLQVFYAGMPPAFYCMLGGLRKWRLRNTSISDICQLLQA